MTDEQADYISLEVSLDGEQLFLSGDTAGLQRMRNYLDRLIANTNDGKFEHIHLMTPEWGGEELSSTQFFRDSTLIHHAKIYCVKGTVEQT
ncbi:MAG: Imm32 family immunity protein [Lacipirellulaceae bacterium]